MFIYTRANLFPSARSLADALTDRIGKKVWITSRPDTNLRGPMIRWGTSAPIEKQVSEIHLWNGADPIRVCANKDLFSRVMTSLGIPHVEMFSGIPEKFPVVVRRTLSGFGGAGIVLAMDYDDWEHLHQYKWSYFRRFQPELGVHIMNGKILRLFKKIRDDGLPEEDFPIRNSHRGYHFSLVNDHNKFPRLLPLVEEFTYKFPILFGRMDVGWNCEEKKYEILEFNTAPGLSENPATCSAYADGLLEIIRKETP